jgi:hypothetical protein
VYNVEKGVEMFENLFINLKMKLRGKMSTNRLYVIVRKDLTIEYNHTIPSVQAGHAVAEFCLRSPFAWKWLNKTIIYLQVRNLLELQGVIWYLQKNNLTWTEFHEPDMNNELTAIAVWMDKETSFFDTFELLEG